MPKIPKTCLLTDNARLPTPTARPGTHHPGAPGGELGVKALGGERGGGFFGSESETGSADDDIREDTHMVQV